MTLRHVPDERGSSAWMAGAACKHVGWWHERGGSNAEEAVLNRRRIEVCESCPVLVECRVYVDANRHHVGVWAGETERMRQRRWASVRRRGLG